MAMRVFESLSEVVCMLTLIAASAIVVKDICLFGSAHAEYAVLRNARTVLSLESQLGLETFVP